MSEVKIYNIAGESVGTMELAPEQLSEGVLCLTCTELLFLTKLTCVKVASNTKTRGESKGSGKKLWKQKGTGRARMGSIRSPLWRGGGVTFGPKPRDFRKDMNKKERRVALMASLAGKLGDNEIVALDSMALSKQNKSCCFFLKAASLEGKVLFVSNEYNADFLRASSNLANVDL